MRLGADRGGESSQCMKQQFTPNLQDCASVPKFLTRNLPNFQNLRLLEVCYRWGGVTSQNCGATHVTFRIYLDN